MKHTSKEEVLKSPLKHSNNKKSVAYLEKKIAELEEHAKKAEKQAERSEMGTEYLDKEFNEATSRKFRDRKGTGGVEADKSRHGFCNFGKHNIGRGGETPGFWMPTTPQTNGWPEVGCTCSCKI